ncbi:metallophosphoesterase [Actinoplanes couchii]|uniref:Membrane protein n=1 Tax=Actinoplanes couchii TaxID=403638 RepID=A0ABQ3X719_9ACTN|nr:metallophosphoesterase [Actinoplanes couchii]MDR6322031.1 putative MPP superfamily phosphohydrolase [Actinoplanes couchii]GID54195.1 membrane protein [Actinoplanes couchii]
MIVFAVLAAVAVVAIFGALHWYLWRRLVVATTVAGSRWRRGGTVFFIAAPLLGLGAMAGEALPVPLVVKSALGWPGYLWLAVFLYLLIAVLVGEVVRPLLTLWLGRKDEKEPALAAAVGAGTGSTDAVGATGSTGVPGDLLVKDGPAEKDEPGDGKPVAGGGPVGGAGDGPAGAAGGGPAGTAGDKAGLSRRRFVSRVVGGTAAAAALGTVGYGTWGVVSGPSVKRITVPLAKLPRSAHGFRIAVVSDVHISAVLGRGFAQRVTDTINATQPDLIAVVGDLVDGTVEDLSGSVEPLRGLRSRHGTFFVTGNHEYFSGVEEWVDKVRELGWKPLENARTAMPGFDLAGVNDVAGEDEGAGPDFVKALGDRDPARASVLMAHQPIVIHDAVKHGVDLQLSGHTHGGQMWPATLIAEQSNPTLAGLERYGDTQLYVSRGAGAWGPPVRVGAPSDITVVELASKQA